MPDSLLTGLHSGGAVILGVTSSARAGSDGSRQLAVQPQQAAPTCRVIALERAGRAAFNAPVLLTRRPTVVARRLDLDRHVASPRRARWFVREACQDWELDALREDAMLVA